MRWSLLMLLALVTAGCAYEDDGNLRKGDVVVPNVDGMNVSDAERMLRGAGMRVSPGETFMSTDHVHYVPRSRARLTVTRQSVYAGAPPGTEVAVATSEIHDSLIQLYWDGLEYADGHLTLHGVHGFGNPPRGCPAVDHVRVGPARGRVRQVQIWGSMTGDESCAIATIDVLVGSSWTVGTVAPAGPTPAGTATPG
jgi:hypothetical protein